MMIVNAEKPSIDEALAHFGVKGMKWGIRKKNRTSLTNIGDRLNRESKIPLTKALVKNGAAFAVAQAAIMSLTGFVLKTALAGMMPPMVSTSYVPSEAVMTTARSIAGAGAAAGLIQAGTSAGITARDLSAIVASDVKRSRGRNK